MKTQSYIHKSKGYQHNYIYLDLTKEDIEQLKIALEAVQSESVAFNGCDEIAVHYHLVPIIEAIIKEAEK